MAVAAPIAMGVASAGLSAAQQSAQSSAASSAAARRNDAVSQAASNTRIGQLAQLSLATQTKKQNISTQAAAMRGALSASSAARGISGSRLAAALQTNSSQQSSLAMQDLATSDLLARKQIDIDYNNALAGGTSYQAPSSGLMLFGAGLQGLQTGLSMYSSMQSWK